MDSTPNSTAAARKIFSLLFSALFLVPALRAQEAVRPSLAGEAAAEARRQSIDQIPYNLLLGPVRFRFSITTGVEYNDNINLSETNQQSDIIIRPQFNLSALWPVTQLNTLKLDLGLGYGFYLDHPNANTNGILIQPGSQLAFDIFIQDFRINIHDRFSLQQDPVSQLQLSNVVDYGRFENTAGVSVLWDLNKAVLTFGYDHYTYVSTTETFSYLDRHAEILSFSSYFAFTSTTGGGIETSAVYNYYNQDFLNDSVTYSVGPFVETQITNYLKLRAAAGYQFINFDSSGTVGDTSDSNDFYANFLISHRINPAITHTLSAGRESQLGVNSNFVALNYVRHTATWNIINGVLLGTELFFEDGDDSGGLFSEHIQRYGGAATLGYQLTPHITLGFRYQYTQKQSDQPLRDYQQNRVSFDGTYSF
ncbi:MAG: outer membrane beta-barrel protein [Verrucomicrobiota bacterium]|nr:outer membrane beta-barrel protein [Verrucomicrobiota bacterium]